MTNRHFMWIREDARTTNPSVCTRSSYAAFGLMHLSNPHLMVLYVPYALIFYVPLYLVVW